MTRPATDSGRTVGEGRAKPSPRPAVPSNESADDTQEFSRLPSSADQTVVMNPVSEFRVGWRGYDRPQVDDYRSRVETELASARKAHERAVREHAQTSERLRTAQADLGRLRGQLTNSPTALSDRLREILHLAEQDADQTRADAETEVDQIRSRARADADTVVQQARDTANGIVNEARAEQEKLKADIEDSQTAARNEVDEAHAEAVRVRDAGEAELRQLAAEAQQARERADADAAARRDEAERHADQQREQAHAAATARLTEMTKQLTDLTQHRDETVAILTRLHQEITKTLAITASPERKQ